LYAGDVREAGRRVRGNVMARRREPPPSPAGASWTPAARKFSDLHHPRQSTRLWSARHHPRPSRIWFRDRVVHLCRRGRRGQSISL